MSMENCNKNCSLSNPDVFEEFKRDYLSWCSENFFRLQYKLQAEFRLNQQKNVQRDFEEHAQLSFNFDGYVD